MAAKLLLNAEQVAQKIRRIAFEIYEKNITAEEIIIAGLSGGGKHFAQRLVDELLVISPLQVHLIEILLDKNNLGTSPVTFSVPKEQVSGQVVVVCDDVLYTGRTLSYSLSPFLTTTPKRLQVAVVVDRNHRLFPIAADFVGYASMTTLNEHIDVILDGQNTGVYLR